jgi:hypothetical protein
LSLDEKSKGVKGERRKLVSLRLAPFAMVFYLTLNSMASFAGIGFEK